LTFIFLLRFLLLLFIWVLSLIHLVCIRITISFSLEVIVNAEIVLRSYAF